MTTLEAIKLVKLHRNSNIKPTDKVKEAIDVLLNEVERRPAADTRVKPLQNRCYVTGATMCPLRYGVRA